MKNRKITQIFLFIAMISALTACFVFGASALEPTGQCGDNVYWNFDKTTGELVISGEGDMWGYEYSAPFYEDEEVETVKIENGVTDIGYSVFYGCTSLTSITIPNSVIYIGNCAFEGCASLISITIPESVTIIGDRAFANCTSLASIAIPASVTYIGWYAFRGCSSIVNIIIPESVESIGKLAFADCNSLTNIIVDPHNEYFSNDEFGALFNKDKTTLIQYPIGNNRKSYTVPVSVKSIYGATFSGCSSLTNIMITDRVTSIESGAFDGCSGLISITVDSANEFYSNDEYGVLFDKTKKTLIRYPEGNSRISYKIPDSVTSIGSFKYCVNLKSITIPNSVTSIEDLAFDGCSSLTSMTIPNGVTEIGWGTFSACTSLTSVTMSVCITSIFYHAFDRCDSLTDVYYTGTEEQWNAIKIWGYNDPLLNATIHFNSSVHTHTPKTITIPATCTVNGMSYTVCETCGETIGEPTIIPAAHTPGEWETVQEPTVTAEGKKVLRCTLCGEIIEEATIPMLQVVSDKGVDLAFPADDYEGEVDVTVEESFDGTAFDIVDTSTDASQKFIYDIKMILNGEEIQPNGKVTIRIPLPAGYDPARTFVYHVNTETVTVENMNARYEDGYLVFETDHFSYYAVVEIAEEDPSDTCTCNCHKGGIVGFFFRLFNFFQKLFGQNKICACGAKH